MRKYIILLAISLISVFGFSQVARSTYDFSELGLFPNQSAEARVIITSDSRLPDIIKGYVNYLYKKPLQGWRVQLYFGIGKSGRQQAEKIKSQFAGQYPDIPVYIFFEQPYFKVKAGNFTSRKSAERLLFLIKQDFPRSFIIEDRIDPNHIND